MATNNNIVDLDKQQPYSQPTLSHVALVRLQQGMYGCMGVIIHHHPI
jgi:hypothetical protein